MINETEIERHTAPERSLAEAALQVVKAPGWVIQSDAQAEQIGEMLKDVKRRWKALEDVRKSITGPLVNAQRNANAFFARGLDPLAELERALKTALGVYEAKKEAARLEAIKTAAIVPAPAPKLNGITTRTVRRWRIKDPDKVPRQFCSPDADKINEHVRNGGIEAIPGVEFYDDTITAVRT